MYCVGCGVEFVPNFKLAKNPSSYCSMPCFRKNHKKIHDWQPIGKNIRTIHRWGYKRIPKPELCECCKKVPPRDLANISQKYLLEVSDWEWLCRGCHMRKDGRMLTNLPVSVRKLKSKNCFGCWTPFTPNRSSSKYCSWDCMVFYKKKKNKPK